MSLFTLRELYNNGMQSDPHPASEIACSAVGLTAPEMRALLDAKEREIIRLRRQVAWFQRQIFGQKSERRLPEPEGVQGTLGEAFDVVPEDVAPAEKTRIAAHEREPKNKNRNLIDGNDDAALFFDESKMPVEVIAVANDEAAGLDPADFEVIGEKVARSSNCALMEPCRVLLRRWAYWTVAVPTSASSPGRRCMPTIRYGRTCMTLAVDVHARPRDRLHRFVGQGPDSMRADADGNVYVAVYGQGRVLAFNRRGILISQVLLPNRDNAHNLASASLAIRPDRNDLFIVASDGDSGEGGRQYSLQGVYARTAPRLNQLSESCRRFAADMYKDEQPPNA